MVSGRRASAGVSGVGSCGRCDCGAHATRSPSPRRSATRCCATTDSSWSPSRTRQQRGVRRLRRRCRPLCRGCTTYLTTRARSPTSASPTRASSSRRTAAEPRSSSPTQRPGTHACLIPRTPGSTAMFDPTWSTATTSSRLAEPGWLSSTGPDPTGSGCTDTSRAASWSRSCCSARRTRTGRLQVLRLPWRVPLHPGGPGPLRNADPGLLHAGLGPPVPQRRSSMVRTGTGTAAPAQRDARGRRAARSGHRLRSGRPVPAEGSDRRRGARPAFPAAGDSPFEPASFDAEFGRLWTVPRRYA